MVDLTYSSHSLNKIFKIEKNELTDTVRNLILTSFYMFGEIRTKLFKKEGARAKRKGLATRDGAVFNTLNGMIEGGSVRMFNGKPFLTTQGFGELDVLLAKTEQYNQDSVWGSLCSGASLPIWVEKLRSLSLN